MICIASALALEPAEPPPQAPEGTAHAVLGNRFDADGRGGAGAIREEIVVGGDGGTYGTTLAVRYGGAGFVTAVYVPFASYQTAGKRSTNLGNLRAEGFWRRESKNAVNLMGLELHVPTGSAWTWTNDAVSFWRSGGVTAVYQRRQQAADDFDVLLRGSIGVHASSGVAPFPRTYPHVSMAVGAHHDFDRFFGYTAELAFSAWDPSPFDLGAWARLTPVEGLQLRVGGILPIGTWLGAAPTGKPAGAREGTLSFSLSIAP